MEEYNSFERLVSGLSSAERIAMLEKIQASIDPESQSLVSSEMVSVDKYKDIDVQYKSESLFLRIWLFIKSLFSSTDVKVLYNAYLVSARGKAVEKKVPHLISASKRVFFNDFYAQIEVLSKCAEFFKNGILTYEHEPGDFYVYLSSLIAPEVVRQISEEVNPSNLSFDREVTNELKLSLVRKLDNIIQSMPSVKRSGLYNAICSVEWLKHFVHLPFSRILSSFKEDDGELVCYFDSVKTEIGQLATILCNGKCIEHEVLEALYAFSCMGDSTDDETFTVKMQKYLEAGSSQIALIKSFITTVPIRSIGVLVNNEALWFPQTPEGCEDWFIKFKNTWRKIFDCQWNQWISDRKKDVLFHSMKKTFGFEKMPLIPNRPWISLSVNVSFTYDYLIGFISTFYDRLYPEYRSLLKTVMLEGVFYQKDNLVELTDACEEMDRQRENLQNLITNLEPEGELGVLFNNLRYENLFIPKGKSKLDALMKSLESETAVIIGQWCSAARSIQLILGGIVSGTRNERYDTLSNLSALQGRSNGEFRKKLIEMQIGFNSALDMIKELEILH